MIQAKKVARLDDETNGCGRKVQKSSNAKEKNKSVSIQKNRANSHPSVSRRNLTEKSSQESSVRKDSTQAFEDVVPRFLPQLDNVRGKTEIDDMTIEEVFELR